jgi:hypothetical protein
MVGIKSSKRCPSKQGNRYMQIQYGRAVIFLSCRVLSSTHQLRQRSRTRKPNRAPIVAKERIKWLASLELQDFARQSWQNLDGPVKLWSSSLLETFRRTIADNPSEHSTDTDIVQFVERRNAAVASCIRSYPINTMSMEEFRACNQALLWCIDHWWLNPYEMRTCQYTPNGDETPRLPDLKTAIISCEFITDIAQTITWCEDVLGRECMC